MHQRNDRLIGAKIRQYLFPGIMMSLAMQLGNVVDTILVGNFLGTDAMAAVSLALPVVILIQIPGYALGMGGALAAGVLLGKRDREGASDIFSLTFAVTVVMGVLFAASAFFVAEPLARVFAKGGPLAQPTRDYLFTFMLGAPPIGVSLLMTGFLGVENHPQLASRYLVVMNSVNLTLDYLFLRFTALGTAGAALSTLLGCLIGMTVFLSYIRSPKRMLTLRRPRALAEPFRSAFVSGVPMLVFMLMTFVRMLGLNTIILRMLGEDGMAVYTVCENVLMIVEMVTGGIIGVIPNIAGILYGERDYYGLRALCTRVLRYTAAAAALVFAAVMAAARPITILFGIADPALRDIMTPVLRLFMLCLPAFVWNKFLISYYESIEQTGQASLITLLQNGVFVLPAALLGITADKLLGGSGFRALALSYVCSEVLTAAAAYVYRRVKFGGGSFYLLPAQPPGNCLDFTIAAELSETPQVPREIVAFCEKNGVGRDRADLAAIAAEEMTVNAIRYGGKSSHWIDVCLTVEERKLLLRVRDNGVPFNPAEYESDRDEFNIHGIELVKAVASRISYIRTIDMNNTVLEFDRE